MNIKQCADYTFALTTLKNFLLHFLFFIFFSLSTLEWGEKIGLTNMPKHMYDYQIFRGLKVTEISGSAMAERKLQALDHNGLANTSGKKSLFQVDLHPTRLMKAACFHSRQLSWKKTCWCENVDIKNNHLAFVKVSLLAGYTLLP